MAPRRAALVMQNSPAEGLGLLGGLLERGGYRVHAERAWEGTGAEWRGEPADLLVVLGGPQGAGDPLPYLRREEGAIRAHAAAGRPVLGICLGAQLAAAALGGRVRRGGAAEAGTRRDLRPTEEGRRGLLAGMGDPFAAFQMHGDAFDLPAGAAQLAGSAVCPNQAFSMGSVVGLQFHLEADAGMIRSWLGAAGLGGAGEAAADAAEIGGNMRAFWRNFAGPAGPGARSDTS